MLKEKTITVIVVIVFIAAGVVGTIKIADYFETKTVPALYVPMQDGELFMRAIRSRKNGDWLECWYSADDYEKTVVDTLWGRGFMKRSLYQGLGFMEAAQAGPTDLVWNVTGRMRLESVEPGFLSLYIDDALVDLSEEADETRMLIDAAMIRSAIKDLEAEKGKSRK